VADPIVENKTSSSIASAGAGLGSAVRLLTSKNTKNILSGLMAGGSSMFASFFRVLRQLMLQVTGFLFLVIAVILGSKVWHEYPSFAATHAEPARFYVTSFFFVLFTYFGLSSFWRARK
jgi:hypothetical protein